MLTDTLRSSSSSDSATATSTQAGGEGSTAALDDIGARRSTRSSKRGNELEVDDMELDMIDKNGALANKLVSIEYSVISQS